MTDKFWDWTFGKGTNLVLNVLDWYDERRYLRSKNRA